MVDKEAKKAIELSADERASLERVAAGDPPHSQRAQALLAQANGASLAVAGAAAGLTENQVRYWLGRFGSRRLSIFPEDLLAAPAAVDETPEPPMLAAPEQAPMLKAPELAGELPESLSASPEAAAKAKSKKKKAKKAKSSKKKKAAAEDKKKKPKKGKKSRKSKKGKKNKKEKKGKKGKKDSKKKKKK